ncbi:MAG: hypothetical protein E7462_06310 [Ruminococcaceae bacterium]|nr:hypothetical protein [Oscillospiraceae bacterium]
MDDMETKLGAILGNPEMMAQIMSMAQQLGGSPPSPQPQQPQPPPQVIPSISGFPEGMDVGMITKLMGMANSATVDGNQMALLRALRPYLSGERIGKLEKAMRAAKLAGFASSFLGSGLLSQTGR